MNKNELISFISKEIPLRYACDWDNSGLQVEGVNDEIHRIYIALDATEDVIYDAARNRCEFLLTHHPLLFKGIKQISLYNSIGRKLTCLISNGITCYSTHTNFDSVPGGMGELAAALLQLQCVSPLEDMSDNLEDPWGIGAVGKLSEPITLSELCERVKAAFCLGNVSLFPASSLEKEVQYIAICPGSGRSLTEAAISKGADVYITGDIGHHEGLDCMEMGVSVIDAGHFGIEKIFIPFMAEKLKEEFPELEIITAAPKAPFIIK